MTNPTTPTAEDPHALPEVTLDRIIEAMKTFDIELEPVTGRDDAATANLNGLPCMFAVLESVAIVRCDVPTDVNYAKSDAGLFLAANQINSVAMGARAVIADFDGMLLVRTEADIPCAAGMTDEQLAAALRASVDGVINAQNAMVAAAEEMAKLGSESAAQAGEGAEGAQGEQQ
ncbi:YbjN domain-containing protein [Corynebacterium aurimucosum]